MAKFITCLEVNKTLKWMALLKNIGVFPVSSKVFCAMFFALNAVLSGSVTRFFQEVALVEQTNSEDVEDWLSLLMLLS